jgi:polar amino acid transport system permease protein
MLQDIALKGRLKIKRLDIAVLLFVLGSGIYLFYRIKIGLHYNWHWSAMPQYLFRYDPAAGRWVPNVLIEGLLNTIRLSAWAMLLATLIGTAMGMLRIRRSLFSRLVGGTYVELTRNLPPLVLIFIFYYFIGDQILASLGIDAWVKSSSAATQKFLSLFLAPPALFTAFLSALITLAVFEGAYITEIVRAGIQSIEKDQWEAADSLGLSPFQRMRHVIFPQAVQRILPPLAGQFISTIKDSAIVSVISIQELTFQGMELMAATYYTFETWILIALLYLVLTLTCSLVIERLELRFRKVGI